MVSRRRRFARLAMLALAVAFAPILAASGASVLLRADHVVE